MVEMALVYLNFVMSYIDAFKDERASRPSVRIPIETVDDYVKSV